MEGDRGDPVAEARVPDDHVRSLVVLVDQAEKKEVIWIMTLVE